MRVLNTDHVPERLREEVRGRAGDVGTMTREAARSAGERVRTTAADQLVKAGKAVEPESSRGRPRAIYLLVVPAVVAGIVLVVRAARSRMAAGEETAGEATGAEGPSAEEPSRADRSESLVTSGNGRAGTERQTSHRDASKAG